MVRIKTSATRATALFIPGLVLLNLLSCNTTQFGGSEAGGNDAASWLLSFLISGALNFLL